VPPLPGAPKPSSGRLELPSLPSGPELAAPALPQPRAPKATEAEVKALVTPVHGKATAQPDAVTPQEAQRKPPQARRQPPTRKLRPGDLVCGDCGEGNAQTRKFCSRCGYSLAAADIVRTPWWRKLFRRGAKVRKSGERPRRSGRGGKSKAGLLVSGTVKLVRRVVAIALLLGGIVYGLFAPFRGWVNERAIDVKAGVEDIFFPTYEPVHAAAPPVAPLQVKGFPAEQALDGASDSAWAAPLGGKREPVIEVTFGRRVDLAQLIVHNGQKEDFKGRARAQRLHLVFDTGRTADVTLADAPDAQTMDVEGEGVTSVEIHVTGTFKSMSGNEVAISELEFFEET
jgi:hypothetical protein